MWWHPGKAVTHGGWLVQMECSSWARQAFPGASTPRKLSCTSGIFLMDSLYPKSMSGPVVNIAHRTVYFHWMVVDGCMLQADTPIWIGAHGKGGRRSLGWIAPSARAHGDLGRSFLGVWGELCSDQISLLLTCSLKIIMNVLKSDGPRFQVHSYCVPRSGSWGLHRTCLRCHR